MSRKIHKATAETSKHQPTTEELRSDVIGKNGYQKQMDAGLTLLKNIKGENGFQKRWEALQIAKEKITAEPNRNLQQLLLTAEKQQKLVREEEKGKLESLKKIVNLHDAKSPDSVIAVFDLVTALNNYNGQISIGNNFFKLRMLHGLGSELKGYFESKQSSPDLLVFEKKCTKIINDNYKYLTMEIGLWNAIKEALKPVLVKLHIDTKRLLSSNDLIKNEKVYGMFHEVVTKGGIEITDEDQIDTKLNP